jgi:hypothetical protein
MVRAELLGLGAPCIVVVLTSRNGSRVIRIPPFPVGDGRALHPGQAGDIGPRDEHTGKLLTPTALTGSRVEIGHGISRVQN